MKFFLSQMILFLLLMFFSALANAGTILVVNKQSNTVSLFNETFIKLIKELPTDFMPHEVAVTPNGMYALVSNFGTKNKPGSTLTAIDIPNKSVMQTIYLTPGSRPHGIQFISDRKALITVGGIQSLLILDYFQAKVLHTIPLPGQGAHMVTADVATRYAYVTNASDGTICKVDLKTFKVVGFTKIGREAEGIALTLDEQLLFITDRKDNIVAVLRTKDLSLVKKIKTDLQPIRVAIFNYGKSALVTNTLNGTAQVIDIASLSIDNTFRTTKTKSSQNGKIGSLILPVPINIAVREDQKTAYITNCFAGTITMVDMDKGDILETFTAALQPDGLALSSFSN